LKPERKQASWEPSQGAFILPVSKEEKKFIEKAVKRLNKGLKADKHNRDAAIDDLKFSNPGDPQQWNQGTINDRKADGRPYLTLNLFPQYIEQVVGDIRHNRPRAKVHPDDSAADVHMARIREGIISDSEYQSNSDYIYVEAGKMNTTCGYGAWRVLTRPSEENPFVQEMYDELIENPFTVVMDPDATCPIYSDANWGFIRHKVPRAEFEEKYPNAEDPSESLKKDGLTYENWWDEDTITVCEYFVREMEKRMMCQLDDGTVLAEKDADELIEKARQAAAAQAQLLSGPQMAAQAGLNAPPASPPGMAAPQPVQPAAPPAPPLPRIVRKRETEITTVKHYKLTAAGILSKNGVKGEAFPGRYIPIILITGNRTNVDGKRYVSGIVRNAKDPAKSVNYWLTSCAERIALEPKAPWVGTPKQFEGFKEDYANANTKNYPYLMYNMDVESGVPAPPPMRQGPGQIPTALFTQLQTSLSLFDSAIGMNKTDLGAAGPERTGAAINARQKPGDIRTFSYIDNLARGIQHGARIKNEMIPTLYDTQRDVRLRNIDDTEAWVPINTTVADAIKAIKANPDRYRGMNTTRLIAAMQQHGPDTKFNDISMGRYAVRVTVGPSYATQRAESSEAMLRLVSALPKQMGIAADLIVKNSDFKDADVLADRLRKLLPPGMVKPQPGEEPSPPPPVPPQMQLVLQKAKTESIKQNKGLLETKVALIKMYKELKSDETEVRKEVLSILAELHGVPAGPPQGGPPQIGG
jgi:hypothetical protein